jgi:hypothetical protein
VGIHTLLVGMYIGAAMIVNSVQILQKPKCRGTVWFSNHTFFEYSHQGNEIAYKRDTCLYLFIMEIFIITKIWNQ